MMTARRGAIDVVLGNERRELDEEEYGDDRLADEGVE